MGKEYAEALEALKALNLMMEDYGRRGRGSTRG